MKNIFTKWRKATASLLAVIMIFASIPMNLIVGAGNQTPSDNGIGVINNAYAENTDHNCYKVEFFKADSNTAVSHSEFSYGTGANAVYIGSDGMFDVNKGAYVDLLQCDDIKEFIDSQNITKVKISFIASGISSNPKDYQLYSVTSSAPSPVIENNVAVYNITKKKQATDSSGNPIFENIVDQNTGEITGTRPVLVDVNVDSSDYKLFTFTSTEIIDHEVVVNWRDTDPLVRPDLSFDITRSYSSVTSEAVTVSSPTIVSDSSNKSVYNYSVPKYNENNVEYNYTSAVSSSVNLSQKGKEYRYEPTKDEQNNTIENSFTFYGKKSFDCSIKWLQGKNNKTVPTEADIKNYITTYFDIYNETVLDNQGNPTTVTISPDRITITRDETTGTAHVSISGLDEITSDGKAQIYFLKRKDNNDISLGDSSGDVWKITADNLGVNSSDIEKVYQGATINNLKSNTVSFTANINWTDESNQTQRQGLTDAEKPVLDLWRYAATGDSDAKDRSAPIMTDKVPVTGTNDFVTFNNLPKYDRNGDPYVYYAKEKFTPALSDYEADYSPVSPSDNIPSGSVNNGGTITNKLSGTRVFTVEAEWKAAARQGGDATVTYQVQYKNSNNEWVHVELDDVDDSGNHLDANGNVTTDSAQYSKTGKLTIKNFKAETMSKTAQFAALPQYDANGKAIEYRVVQTSVSRTDNSITSTPITNEIASGTTTVTMNGDEYDIIVSNSGDKYHFTYQLTGTMPLKIVKVWNDDPYAAKHPGEQIPDHHSDTVQALVKQFDFDTNAYVDYSSQDPHYNVDGTFHITDNDHKTISGNTQTWWINLDVPIYDENGHQYQYTVTEKNTFPHYDMTVGYQRVLNTETNKNEEVYTITNKYSPDEGANIVLKKEWQDDGDLLHRKSMTINYTAALNGTAGSSTLTEENVWEAHPGRYKYYTYDSDDFTERNTGGTYTSVARIHYDYLITATFTGLEAGIYQLLQKQEDGTWIKLNNNNDITITSTSATDSFSQILNNSKQPLKLQKQVPDSNDLTATTWQNITALTDSNITFNKTASFNVVTDGEKAGEININYSGEKNSTVNPEGWMTGSILSDYPSTSTTDVANLQLRNFIGFDNLVGVYKDDDHYYAVEQKFDGNNTVTFTNTRIGVISYKVELEWLLGDWITNNPNKYVKVKLIPKVNGAPLKDDNDQDISIVKDIPISSAVSEYYLTNLPKYNDKGVIIDWVLEEISVADQPVNLTTGNCNLNGHNCDVTVSHPAYSYGTDSHSDDLITVKLTNQFSDSTTATINKVWFDDSDILNLRSDTYIKLYRRHKGTSDDFIPHDNVEYAWSGQGDNWTYTFTGLPKYDDAGYEYEYAILELPIQDYSTTRYSHYNEQGNNDELSSLGQNLVPSGGCFVDTLFGKVVIKGEKLWNNILDDFSHSHYPIAKIKLFKRDKYQKDANGAYILDSNSNKQLTTDSDNIKIGHTTIYKGDNKYVFKPTEIDYPYYLRSGNDPLIESVTFGSDTIDSLVLPKFDEYGSLIYYSLDEESINGYTFKISNDEIVNEFNGGRPVEITVTKKWENMNSDSIYPTIKLVLHQILFAKVTNDKGEILQNDGTYSANATDYKLTPVEYATYEKILTKDIMAGASSDQTLSVDTNGNWVYTFGKISSIVDGKVYRYNSKENLREIAPDGSYFQYYITEELSTYEGGQPVELNALDNGDTQTFLGDFYAGNAIQTTIQNDPDGCSNLDEKYGTGFTIRSEIDGFKVKEFTQPVVIDGSEGSEFNRIQRSASIKNSYEPEVMSYQGNIYVSKSWVNYTGNDQNPLNEEFTDVKDYAVIISRKTAKIGEEKLFKVNTKDSNTGIPAVSIEIPSEHQSEDITEGKMTAHKSDGSTASSGDTIAYYEETINFKKTVYTGFNDTIPVKFRIYKGNKTDEMYNKIEIHGLAIYAQDATKYTYVITEYTPEANTTDPMNSYIPKYKTASNTWSKNPVGKKMDDNDRADFSLRNDLKVFTLNLYKVFGKKYEENNTTQRAILDPADYSQYFNDEFVDQLRFEIYRKKGTDGEFEKYYYADGKDANDQYSVKKVVKNTSSNSKIFLHTVPTENFIITRSVK